MTLVGTAGNRRPDADAGVDVEHTWASKAEWAHVTDRFEYNTNQGADLHNLFATRRGINRSRGNLSFGILPADARELRVDPDGTLNKSGGGIASGSFRDANEEGVVVFQPRADHRGNVARAMFYMSVRYWMPIPEDMENALKAWHLEDPVDTAEEARNGRIEGEQQNRNPFIDTPELVGQITDF